MANRDCFDICIVGAGVVGLAIAYELGKKYQGRDVSIVVLEQEASFGQHISSRNSEVIHAGIYYPPHSLKATLCVQGKELLYSYCRQFDVPHQKLGKLIVAKAEEVGALEQLNKAALDNGVFDLRFIERARLKKIEPSVHAQAALLSPSTGIIDSHSYMQSLLHQAEIRGVQFSPYTRVERVLDSPGGFTVCCQLDEKRKPEPYQFDCRLLINAAGLNAQLLASAIEAVPRQSIPKLYYCKGDYFDYRGRNPFRHLIYPMPEANTAGLGIHATMDLSGQLKFGPDADYIDHINYEVDLRKACYFAARIASYFSPIEPDDLKPAYSGIRPKLAAPGEPAADYVIQDYRDHGVQGLIQLFGMESPALTSSLAIARYVSDRIEL
ncbi:MAG: NAD(P)/FAD-dependent oxidoreductase [Pseudohongiellaceae bacterium]